YRPLVRRSKPVLKLVKTWPERAISALQDCFECTDWDMFREAATNGDTTDLEEYMSSVTSYISKCIDDVTISKSITTRSNQKPWMTAKVLKSSDSAFRAGDKDALRTARAKQASSHQGGKACTLPENPRPLPEQRHASLPDALNSFYAQFEAENDVTARKTIPPPEDQVLCLTMADVRKTLCRVNPRKAAGPDNIPGRVLRECAEQLADVFTDIFNIYLSSAFVPTCLKTTTIIPVPEEVSSVLSQRISSRCIHTHHHEVLREARHEANPGPAATITRPHAVCHLTENLSLLGINTSLCNWILDFLTGRPQSVRIRNSTSSTTKLNTGAPQGCVLSPLLFTLLTHDCAAMHSSNHIIKVANDTTVVGLISKNDERAQSDHSPLDINGSNVEIVKSTKFLSVHLAEDLTWSLNTSSITKKAQQHLYFLRRLRKAHLPPVILTTFYRGTIESILSNCITAWFGNCTISDRKTLQGIVRTAEKIIGVTLPSIMDIYSTRCIRKANSIVDDPTHPSHTLFTLLPSGKREQKHFRDCNREESIVGMAEVLQYLP
ncbi:hypothetical protein QTP86_016659, partial [Hemibagrus guttatus]